MRFPKGKAKAFTMSYDDGVEQDVQLMKIMDQNGIKGTFNINSGLFAKEGTKYEPEHIHRRMTQSQAEQLYQGTVHEVAAHGLTHPYFTTLPMAQASYEILEDRRRLEQIFHHTIRGMAYPFGKLDEEIEHVLKATGICYARTIDSTEAFDLPQNWLRWNPTCKHKCKRLMELAEQFIAATVSRQAQLFYLWGHSYEFEADQNWKVIEDFCEKIGNKEDIWYATNIEIYDYVTAYEQLRFGVEMQFVENPTAMDLFFSWKEDNYCVKAGESLKLK